MIINTDNALHHPHLSVHRYSRPFLHLLTPFIHLSTWWRKDKALWSLINNLKSHLLWQVRFQIMEEMWYANHFYLLIHLNRVVTGLFAQINVIRRDIESTVCVCVCVCVCERVCVWACACVCVSGEMVRRHKGERMQTEREEERVINSKCF